MLQSLMQFLNSFYPLNEQLAETIEKNLEVIEVPKQTLLLKDGERCDYVFVVLKGIARMYYLKDGEEVCSRFSEENQMILSVKSFFARVPGYEYIETIENCTIARIHHDNLQKIYREFIEFNFVARIITEQYFMRSEDRLYLLRRQSAEERYVYLTEHHASLVLRVPLKYIASYLGINMETLSRIRKKLATSKH